MEEEIFRPTKKKPTSDPSASNPLEHVQQIQEAVIKETGKEMKSIEQLPFTVGGNVPPEFREAMARRAQMAPQASPQRSEEEYEVFEAPPDKPRPQARLTPDAKFRVQGGDQLESLLQTLTEQHMAWEEFEFPSKGKFYTNIPGTIHIRAMTGQEEQILATPRLVKRNKAIDMIFSQCIKESFNTEDLLSADRTNLLIFLRGISYTPEYDVEVRCPGCTQKFAHVINLDQLEVDVCPDKFGVDDLAGKLPVSGFRYTYRLPTGADEQEISSYRERRIAQWGDQNEDDTLLYRTALLLTEIEGVVMKKELAVLLKRLPIQDVAHLRNEINTPPFGVNTQLPLLCPNCNEEFKMELPLETGFFFPRKKMEKSLV